MASVIISGDTSGAVTITAPAVAGTPTLTLPTTTGILATLTTPSFTTTIGVGAATASASGSGISFPATQSASSNANTLDDYEEGTWTPTIESNSGATGQAYSIQNGTYTKIGRQVTLMFDCILSTKGSFIGLYVQVKGFPFTVATLPNATGGSPVYFTNLAENWIYLSLQTEAGNTAAYVWGQTTASANRTYIGSSAIGNTTQFNCCLTYFV